ncbi:MAG: Xaa-Pro peptidase family protein [Clostridia bacterium]|nr:Xaa-Pro peptidase family protein [Clostridia bacterium]
MSHLSRLKEAMKTKGFDAVIISSEINQRYLTGFNYSDGLVVVTSKRACLLTDFRYIEAAKGSRAAAEFEIMMPHIAMIKAAKEIIDGDGAREIAVEEATLALADYNRYCEVLEGCHVIGGASAMTDGLREFKDEEEIAKMQQAQDIADLAFTHILDFIKLDMTEQQVALELEFFMRAHGAEAAAFETIAVSGAASSMPHGVPRDVVLEKGFLTMDFGARVDGYDSDMTRTIVIGKADADMKRLYDTVLKAQLAGLDLAAPGVPCCDMDITARNIIDGAGYEGCFGHSLGHGVGMYIHEAPSLSSRVPRERLLTPGQIVTVEPGIYIEGKYGCRIEDMIAVLDNGIHNFTHSPKELIEIC